MALDLTAINAELKGKEPVEIVRWAVETGGERTICSTNFRPFEAVILHLVTQVKPDLPIVWVDQGVMLPETYIFAEKLIKLLNLNMRVYMPRLTEARREALYGSVPTVDEAERHATFTEIVKIEPFRRAMKELKPKVWLTALRRETAFREGLEIVSADEDVLKVSPLLDWSDADMRDYLEAHDLPNESIYYDPAKGDAKRECGIHTISMVAERSPKDD